MRLHIAVFCACLTAVVLGGAPARAMIDGGDSLSPPDSPESTTDDDEGGLVEAVLDIPLLELLGLDLPLCAALPSLAHALLGGDEENPACPLTDNGPNAPFSEASEVLKWLTEAEKEEPALPEGDADLPELSDDVYKLLWEEEERGEAKFLASSYDESAISKNMNKQAKGKKGKEEDEEEAAPAFVELAERTAGKWPEGVIPFYFEQLLPRSAFEAKMMTRFLRGAAWLSKRTNLRVVPCKRNPAHAHIRVVTHETNAAGSCGCHVGMQGGQQDLDWWGDHCKAGSAVHELLHGAGFHHEQVRKDRNAYVTIDPAVSASVNFQQVGAGYTDDGTYNLDSIMHYSQSQGLVAGITKSFTIKPETDAASWKALGKPKPIDSKKLRLGQRTSITSQDVKSVNQRYPKSAVSLSKVKFSGKKLELDHSMKGRRNAKFRNWAVLVKTYTIKFESDSKPTGPGEALLKRVAGQIKWFEKNFAAHQRQRYRLVVTSPDAGNARAVWARNHLATALGVPASYFDVKETNLPKKKLRRGCSAASPPTGVFKCGSGSANAGVAIWLTRDHSALY